MAGKTIGYVTGLKGELNGRRGRPFYRLRLDTENVDKLLHLLDECARTKQRAWFNINATYEKPERLKLTQEDPPAFEAEAAAIYLRGAFRISGNEGSCNIVFSANAGVAPLADRLRIARQRMRHFLDLRVPNRKWDLIEFIPDLELESQPSLEHERLTLAGGLAAAEVLPAEDFSDWEKAGA